LLGDGTRISFEGTCAAMTVLGIMDFFSINWHTHKCNLCVITVYSNSPKDGKAKSHLSSEKIVRNYDELLFYFGGYYVYITIIY
jgi:hypothetical protein